MSWLKGFVNALPELAVQLGNDKSISFVLVVSWLREFGLR